MGRAADPLGQPVAEHERVVAQVQQALDEIRARVDAPRTDPAPDPASDAATAAIR